MSTTANITSSNGAWSSAFDARHQGSGQSLADRPDESFWHTVFSDAQAMQPGQHGDTSLSDDQLGAPSSKPMPQLSEAGHEQSSSSPPHTDLTIDVAHAPASRPGSEPNLTASSPSHAIGMPNASITQEIAPNPASSSTKKSTQASLQNAPAEKANPKEKIEPIAIQWVGEEGGPRKLYVRAAQLDTASALSLAAGLAAGPVPSDIQAIYLNGKPIYGQTPAPPARVVFTG